MFKIAFILSVLFCISSYAESTSTVCPDYQADYFRNKMDKNYVVQMKTTEEFHKTAVKDRYSMKLESVSRFSDIATKYLDSINRQIAALNVAMTAEEISESDYQASKACVADKIIERDSARFLRDSFFSNM